MGWWSFKLLVTLSIQCQNFRNAQLLWVGTWVLFFTDCVRTERGPVLNSSSSSLASSSGVISDLGFETDLRRMKHKGIKLRELLVIKIWKWYSDDKAGSEEPEATTGRDTCNEMWNIKKIHSFFASAHVIWQTRRIIDQRLWLMHQEHW